VINHPDLPYFTALGVGLAGSLITLGILLWKTRGDRVNQ
jgi:hypothetical protein